MSRFKFKEHGNMIADCVAEIERKYQADTEEIKKSTALILNQGSSGTKVLAETDAYKKWLTKQQELNPFIGKDYMQRAEEFERDSEEITPAEAMADNEAAKLLEKDDDGNLHIKDDYNPNVEDDGEALTGTAASFNDLCLINNIVATRIGWDFDDVMKDVTAALEEEHDGELDFELPENLADTVQMAINGAEFRAQIAHQSAK